MVAELCCGVMATYVEIPLSVEFLFANLCENGMCVFFTYREYSLFNHNLFLKAIIVD